MTKKEKLKQLKESLEKEKARLLKIKESKENPLNGFSKLLEADLDQAKIILAAQDIVSQLQKMAEQVADIGTSDLMPLVDQMRDAFGADLTTQFESTVDEAVQNCLDTLRDTKDKIGDAVLVLQGEKPSSDIEQDTGLEDSKVNTDANDEVKSDISLDVPDLDDAPPEPMGRAKRTESFQIKKKTQITESEKSFIKEIDSLLESDLSKQKKLKSLSFKKYKAKTINEMKYISKMNYILSNNLLSWANTNNNLKESILDLNFKKEIKPSKKINENINLLKTLLTFSELNETKRLIKEGKKLLKTNNFQTLLSKFILENVDNFSKQDLSNISDKIINISLSNPELATGILKQTIDNISTKIAPSAKNAVIIPTYTFESISNLLKRNKRKVNGNSIINYIYNNFYNSYQAIICEKEGESLVFGFYNVVDKKLKKSNIENSNMNQETNDIIISTIINEVIQNSAKRIEFNVSSFKEILPKIKNILEKNGYYLSKESDRNWIVFEDGVEPVKEMEDWDYHLDDQEYKSQDGELSPMSITMEKRPKSGMNESVDNIYNILNDITKKIKKHGDIGMNGDCGMFALSAGKYLQKRNIPCELIFFIESIKDVDTVKEALDNELLCYHVSLEVKGLPKGKLFDAEGIVDVNHIDEWIAEEYDDAANIIGEDLSNKYAIKYINNDTNWKNNVNFYNNIINSSSKIEEDLSQQDQENITSALGVLSSDLANNPSSKNAPASNALNKLTAQEKDALRKSAPQSMDNSQNLGDFLNNANKELSSKGDTISKDLQGTNKNKEPITSFGTEQNTTPNTNDVNN